MEVKMKKNSEENESASLPVKMSDFKPRIDKYRCQYCGYTSRNCNNVDDHVNTQHEMKEWFKCKICKYVTLHHRQMKLHLNRHHKLKVVGAEIRKLIVKDLKEILKRKKAMINRKNVKTKIGKMPEFTPIDEENFKPRKYSEICQYCDYRSRSKENVDEHVNACHEMIHWYQCNQCPYVTLLKCSLRCHVLTMHNQKLTSTFINDLIIKDQVKIDHLKKSNILKKKRKDEFLKIPLEQLSKESKFIPIDNADFKPRIYPLICQYCGFSGKAREIIDNHINSHHEFTTWFKCDECDYAALCSRSIKRHFIVQHLTRNVNKDKIEKLLVKDQKEIDQLKRKWTGKKQVQNTGNKQFSKLLHDRQMCKESKFIAIDRLDFKPRLHPRICQYCGFTTKSNHDTTCHVNSFHEMTDWYQCDCCDYASLTIDHLRSHLKSKHSKDISKDRPESCLIKDQEVIDCLQSKKIQLKKSREELSMLLPEELSNKSKYLPVDKVNFKPRVNLQICQYCGFSRKNAYHINEHVNIWHEMITWYKCAKCKCAFLSTSQLRIHLQNVHSVENITEEKLRKCIIKNKDEIRQLKKMRIKVIKNQEKGAKPVYEIVEKVRQMIPPDVFKFKPRTDPNVCQYCGYFNRKIKTIDFHVNAKHEMIIWYKCNLCALSSTNNTIFKRHFSKIHNKMVASSEMAMSMITDLEEICDLRKYKTDKSNYNSRKTALNSDSFERGKEVESQADDSDDEDCFQSESDDGSDTNINALIKLKALSVVLQRLDIPITKDYYVSGNEKVNPSSTGDIEKEETLLNEDDNEVKEEIAWENEDSDEYNKDALDGLDEEWLTGASW